jgi:hypothetical protein
MAVMGARVKITEFIGFFTKKRLKIHFFYGILFLPVSRLIEGGRRTHEKGDNT